jgi:peptide-methionine (S)-S-oxide reductase
MTRIALLALGLLLACSDGQAGSGRAAEEERRPAAAPVPEGKAEAIFAAGCFWCSESDFEKVAGVISVESGYAGGHVAGATYEEVGAGGTGHTEAIRVIYDPGRVSYEILLNWYWRHVDFTDGKGQFCDRGSQYRPAILPVNAEQRAQAEKSRAELEQRLGRQKVGVTIEEPGTFWVAEDYHQDFYKKSPTRYAYYRRACGRDERVESLQPLLGGQR